MLDGMDVGEMSGPFDRGFGVLVSLLFSFIFVSILIFYPYTMTFYYIDRSVLLENIPLVKFIKTTSGTRVVYFP